jgi:uncharacterized protein (DUF1499 family)
MKFIGIAVLLVFVLMLLAVIAGQAGWLAGKMPADLGVKDGRLKPPALTPNSVSSQADLYADHPQKRYASVAPFRYSGDPQAAMGRLAAVLEATPGCVLVTREPGYLYAQCSTRLLKYMDDVEFALDEAAQLVHVRSASRIGRGDLGLNRKRVEALRAQFENSGTASPTQ